jgi:hypothetical protein
MLLGVEIDIGAFDDCKELCHKLGKLYFVAGVLRFMAGVEVVGWFQF